MRRVLVGILVLLGMASAQFKSEYKLSVVVAPNTAWGMGAQKFADLVKEKTGGRVNIKVYFSGQLFAGQQTNEFQLLRTGVADFAIGSTINWSPQVKELNLFNLPFFFPSYKELDAVEEGQAGKAIFQRLKQLGVEPLAWGENGYRQLTNSKRPVRTPEDLQGLKIRVVGAPIFIDTFRALGANPTSMSWAEVLTALQQGVIEGQENPIVGVIIPYKLWELGQRYLTVWNYVIDPLIFAASAQTWRTFPADVQKAIQEAALEAARYQKALARAGMDDGSALRYLSSQGVKVEITDPLGYLRAQGVQVTVLSPLEIGRFRERVAGVVQRWMNEIGGTLVVQAEADKKRAR
ncbi:DctP family TRAP transporter solute-binding subunit [Thermus tengchongensis]|uniref:DctP family TRAP transporter solute-binding subunit n=1 Tax=Thermus tengchongensis TaxID=1214928 RepID=A0ABY2K416_9DEIN|nr:DctP family TRAP transporter solute-binding subunit [Thermus tengchongensis]TFU14869.1 DctP family TRAP transporter solute-binding subunit [Thermus tengchongensis]